MAWELEGLISHLLMLISCAGEQGCAVQDIVNEIKGSSGIPGSRSHNAGEPLSDPAAATIWQWLVERTDVSVGADRKYNEVPLRALLDSTTSLADKGNTSKRETDNASSSAFPEPASGKSVLESSSTIRVFVLEDTMWEVITGHSVNYKRVPRLEWLLLLGIASTKAQGILQGDLGRLVEQDKRSVPKRTDSLLKKGYIVKRTTLVRGTKTSKLWLKFFAPPLPKESDNQDLEREAEMNMSYQTLAANLDQVPWHTRWTGDSMDFHALATTIMAVSKEWQVIRLQDLKAKLGVLGMRWQMKIVSKICRFLNSCGAIQYVAAKLDNKVYKDCIRYNTDLSAKDWSSFLATGKRSSKRMKTALLGMAERADPDWQADISQINGASLGECPPWSIDEPLPQKITKSAQAFGTVGLTNPEIYVLTLGPTFNRYLSSLTSCMTTSNVQPPELKHLQLKSEHIRVGKVASYRFYTPQIPPSETIVENQQHAEGSIISLYGFSPRLQTPRFSEPDVTLSSICGVASSGKKNLREQRKRACPKKIADRRPISVEPETIESKMQQIVRVDQLLITLRVSAEALRNIMLPITSLHATESPSSSIPQPIERENSSEESISGALHKISDKSDCTSRPNLGQGRGRGHGRGRGRPALSSSDGGADSSRPWTCENCGGSWKNDIGLKYHLEKSQSSCNPQYVPIVRKSGGRGKGPAIVSPRRGQGSSDADFTDETPRSRRSAMNRRDRKTAAVSSDGGHDRPKVTPISKAGRASLEQNQNEETRLKTPSSPATGTVKSWRRSTASLKEPVRFSLPKINQGLLSPRAGKPQVQDSILQEHMHLERSVASDGTSSRAVNSNSTEFGSPVARPLPSTPTGEGGRGGEIAQPVMSTPNPISILDQVQKGDHRPISVTLQKRDAKLVRGRMKNFDADLALLIQKLLGDQKGVVVGGKPLWDSILAVWNDDFSEKPAPSKIQFQSTVNRLLKDGKVLEHWHAFRDSSGSFSKCQLLTLPGVDAFSLQSLELLGKLKRPLPSRGEVVLAPDSNAGLSEVKVGGRGRRMLAKEVATLHAPVYAAQVAAKKDPASEPRDRSKRQRHSAAQDGIEDFTSELPAKRARVDHVASSEGQPDFLIHHNRFGQEVDRTLPALKLHFLEPNQFLGREALDMQTLQTLSPDSEQSPIAENLEPEATYADGSHVNSCDKVNDTGVNEITEIETSHDDVTILTDSHGVWPTLDTQYFECQGRSFAICGWMPDAHWLEWESFSQDLEKRSSNGQLAITSSKHSGAELFQRFKDRIRACFKMEMKMLDFVVSTRAKPIYPYNIYVRLQGDAMTTRCFHDEVTWPADGQLSTKSENLVSPETEYTSSSSDDDLDVTGSTSINGYSRPRAGMAGQVDATSHVKAKRIALVTRSLTSLPGSLLDVADDAELDDNPLDDSDELIAAFIAVRTLMGGADKSIDWGLLLLIYPDVTLRTLRKFWDNTRKQQGLYISTYTRAFQERLIPAFELGDVPMVDFDKPQEYDWSRLIRWTMEIPRQEGFELPRSRETLNSRFSLADTKTVADDWRERFFHVQASVFARFEAVTSLPAALAIDDPSELAHQSMQTSPFDIARSWVKSLCGTEAGKYSVETIRDKFFTLMPGNKCRTSTLFKEAIDQLTKQRIICKSKKPPLGGRPYRLNEGYLASLSKMAQTAKYDGAARFKVKLDAAFRKDQKMVVPYSFSDGAMMALTNLNAAGRIRLVATNLPYIPFGFEPGNYESRKYPKSYYHFGLEAVPTETYLFNEQIDVLQAAHTAGPPLSGQSGELPQWVDIFGEPNQTRWSEILGGFCFAMATRGAMNTEGICSALNPILDPFEARIIVSWGKRTGVFNSAYDGIGSPIGEWWWLVVPWLRRMPSKVA